MKRFLLLCLTTLFALTTWGQTFSSTNDDGVSLSYSSVSSSKYDYACVVTGTNDRYCEEINIPSTVSYNGDTYTVIGIREWAFMSNSYLIRCTTPNTLEYIEEWAFSDCSSLEEFTLGKSVERLSDAVFQSCRKLTTINSLNPEPPSCELQTFYTYSATLYVPSNAISAYRSDMIWGMFNIEAYVDTSLPTVVTAAATDVTQNTATLHGTVTGGEVEITEQGFEYYTGNGTVLTITAEGEEMTALVENLSAGTTYYFHAYAQCGEDVAYGDDLYFATMCDYDLLSDGLYYRITSPSKKTCAVTCLYLSSANENVYIGDINIPESVEIDGQTYTVTGIDDSAFYYCRNLTSVSIPETVTSIGTYAFYYCSSLTSVTIPSSVTSIGDTAFGFCGLTELTIPNSVTSIGTYAFRNNTSLLKATVGDGMKTIPEGMFYNCTKVEEVEVPNDITSIGREGFCNCSSLKEFTIPETVTSIGNSAFMLCSSLTSMVVPDGVTSLNYTFERCTALEEVTLGKYTVTLGQEVFDGCSSLKEISLPETLRSIGSYCFVDCTSLTELIIPDAVTSLGYESFDRCSGLTEVKFGSGLKEIGGGAFYKCTGLTSLEFPDALESIGYESFAYCSNLEEVKFGSGLKEIDGDAFYKCTSLPSITIPGSVETMGSYAFAYCDILSDVTMNEGLKEIGSDAFYKCISLPSITIPGSVETMGSYAFAYCDILSDVTMNEGLKEIGSDAFYHCEALTSIKIPGSVETMGSYAFAYCYNLADVTMNEGVNAINNYAFYHCEALPSINIPKTVETIGSYAFEYCYSLTEVKVGNNATKIDSGAFSYCSSLTNVSLGKSLETFGQTVFSNCSKLSKVISLNPEPPTATYSNVFNNIYDRCILYVPLGSSEAYSTAKVWQGFFYDIIELADVETLDATDVTETSATLHGTIEVGELCETTTSKGFEIWEEANPDNVIIRLVSGDSLTCVIDGLSLETTYVYHAFVSTATSSSYGDDVEFTTLSIPGTFVCMVEPTKGTDVDELSQLAFYNPLVGEEIFINEELARDPEIHVYNEAGDVVTSISYFDTIFSTDFTKEYAQIAVFEDTVTEGGTYTVSVPAEQFIIYDENGKTYYNEAMTLTYTIVGDTTGINGISTNLDSENVEGIYSTSGQKLNSTVKGVNIIRYTDGTVKKIYVK